MLDEVLERREHAWADPVQLMSHGWLEQPSGQSAIQHDFGSASQ